MTVNKELLKTTMELIKLHPDTHNQDMWVTSDQTSPCGTTMCFAGHAAVLAGAEKPDPKKHNIIDWYVGSDGKYLNYHQKSDWSDEFIQYGTHVQNYACEVLGISQSERDYMFSDLRSVEDLQLAVDELVEYGAIQTYVDEYYDEDEDDDYCECCDF